jgi:hypothetical protein
MLRLILIGFILTIISVFVVNYNIWLGLFIYLIGFVGSIAVLLIYLLPKLFIEDNKVEIENK